MRTTTRSGPPGTHGLLSSFIPLCASSSVRDAAEAWFSLHRSRRTRCFLSSKRSLPAQVLATPNTTHTLLHLLFFLAVSISASDVPQGTTGKPTAPICAPIAPLTKRATPSWCTSWTSYDPPILLSLGLLRVLPGGPIAKTFPVGRRTCRPWMRLRASKSSPQRSLCSN